MTAAILFDRDAVDHLDRLAERPRRLRGSQLLWVDIHGDSEVDISEIADAFDLDATTRNHLSTPHEQPVFNDLFQQTFLFWVTVGVIIGIAPIAVGFAKLRHWI